MLMYAISQNLQPTSCLCVYNQLQQTMREQRGTVASVVFSLHIYHQFVLKPRRMFSFFSLAHIILFLFFLTIQVCQISIQHFIFT